MWWLFWIGCDGDVGVANIGALEGQDCEATVECAGELICAHDGTCQEAGAPGTAELGGDCLHAEECALGLVCDADGVCAEPGAEGTGLEDDACASDEDCALGLVCDDGACVDLGVPYWGGVECEPDGDAFALHFEVPSLPADQELEFYRLPFATDVRADREGLDLSGHPDPGEFGPDVATWLAALETVSGFGLNPTVTLRGAAPIDPDTVAALSDGSTLYFAALDEDADDYGLRGSFVYRTVTARGRYACQNQVSVRTFPGVALRPNATYAVWLTTGVRDGSGSAGARSDDVASAMADASPSDARLLASYAAAEPLRAFLTRNGLGRDEVATFAVFTTGDPGRAARNLPGTLSADTSFEPVDCASSDCGDCGAQAGHTELHGRIRVSTYQDDAGVFQLEDGIPVEVDEEDACVALTLPTGEEPEDGWPIVVVVQDEGSSFRDWIDSGLAEELADAGVAAISVELPHHGERGRGDATLLHLDDPERWVGDRLQIAADLSQLARVLDEQTLGTRHLVGHGVGGELALAFLSTRDDFVTASLGGVGGGTDAQLLHGTRDGVPLSRELQVLLADTRVGTYHPMVALMQLHNEPADGLTHARGVWKDPAATTDASHVLHVYGLADSQTSIEAQQALQTALGLPTVTSTLVDDFDQGSRDAPVTRNLLNEDGDRVTGASVQLDGGREAIWSDEGRAWILRFIASGLGEDEPTIE
ncbi:MAG: hypothetical protein GY913_13390 [Proteobacteria bacterium]|nr:hypothetical protein [Pseudomonadota bacterium]MCP4917901.1 hypothetical protein [Pseudomonadota bacterium]